MQQALVVGLWEVAILFVVGVGFGWPIFDYFRDPKRLRRFSAPSIAGFTNLWMMKHQWFHNRAKATHEAHKRLGKIVRVGPNHVSFVSRQAVKDIYGHGSPATKDKFYMQFTGTHESSLDTTDRQVHGEKRKRLAAAFAQKNIVDMEHVVIEDTQKLLKRFDQTAATRETIDVSWFINLFLFDMTGDLVFSHHLGCVERGDDMMLAQKLDGTVYEVHPVSDVRKSLRIGSSLGWYTPLYHLNKRLTAWHEGWTGGSNWTAIVLHMVRTRLEKEKEGKELNDFFKALLWTKDHEPLGLEIGELVAECSLLLLAGSDTATIALVSTIFLLTKWPEAAAKLRKELDDAIDETEVVPAYDAVKNLPYLRAVLDETMRMRPSLPGGLPRFTPPEGMMIEGEWIPGNTTVSVPTWSLHHSPEYFKDPEVFKPERWLAEDAAELQSTFIPFSAGGRACSESTPFPSSDKAITN
jgi:benzoate 4-monooxygenase